MNKLPKDVIYIIYRFIFRENMIKVCAEIHDWCETYNTSPYTRKHRTYLLRDISKKELPLIVQKQIHSEKDMTYYWRRKMWYVIAPYSICKIVKASSLASNIFFKIDKK